MLLFIDKHTLAKNNTIEVKVLNKKTSQYGHKIKEELIKY
jgi:hypothetical protein